MPDLYKTPKNVILLYRLFNNHNIKPTLNMYYRRMTHLKRVCICRKRILFSTNGPGKTLK